MNATVQAGTITPRAVVQAAEDCPMAARGAYVEPAPMPVAIEIDWDDVTEVTLTRAIEAGDWGWV